MLKTALSNAVHDFEAVIAYVKARLLEKSTYAGLVLAVAGGQGFAHPWDYVAVAAGMLAVFAPTKGSDNG